MANIIDDLGYNQIFKASLAMEVRTRRRAAAIVSQMQGENLNVLEIGCGSGELSFFISDMLGEAAKVIGIDICESFILKAQKKYQLPNLDFMVFDFKQAKQIGKQKFDYVVGNGMLHHFYYELDEALANIKWLLKPGGKIIFFEPNLLNPYCYLIFNTTQWMRHLAKLDPNEMAFSKKFINKHLTSADFKNIRIAYRDFLLPNTPAILIKPLCFIGAILEKIPFLNCLSQSLLVSGASKH
ncbi:MAG: class I SAM-dependent methyltransferase [Deltaproteobacteria bacterium]|jgi:ubiquinone/menaquinone biosynthesis C-methylase UbiE|nr:class I SAM-dependent methyltransferase [Deltaproteobacteria bacterium]